MRATLAVCAFAWAWSMAAAPHPAKPAAIDEHCQKIRNEFLEAGPRVFSGPEPWVELEKLPDAFADDALATVYYEGARIRWVILEMQAPDEAWFETTNYFFSDGGSIAKRERHLEHHDSHIAVDEELYFNDRKVIKTRYRHRALDGGKENWETFYDPDAPFYTATADLPVLFLKLEFGQLANFIGDSKWRLR